MRASVMVVTRWLLAVTLPVAVTRRDATGQVVTRVPAADSTTLHRLEAAASPAYAAKWRADEGIRPGRQRVAVMISSRDCIGGKDPRFIPALRAALRLLADEARREGVAFSASGVAIDWEPDSAVNYLRRLADFDQWLVGRNWANDAVVRLVWQDSSGVAAVPQLIVYEQQIRSSEPTPTRRRGGLDFSSMRVLHRFLGAGQLSAWVLEKSGGAK